MRYWLDADVFITAATFTYPINNAIGFWKWLDGAVADGTMVAPRRVYEEVIKGRKPDDPLRKWIQRHKPHGLCVKTLKEVDAIAGEIGDYVWTNARYPTHHRLEFSRGGDAWLIAAAMHDRGTVLTNESDKHPDGQKPRIPDLCDHFKVRCLNLTKVILELDAKF